MLEERVRKTIQVSDIISPDLHKIYLFIKFTISLLGITKILHKSDSLGEFPKSGNNVLIKKIMYWFEILDIINRESKFHHARMRNFKYIGSSFANENSIQEEIKSKVKVGNSCYYTV